MQVKVFEAEDMRSALEKVKQALGPEALILSTKTIGRNKFGFSSKNRIEVTAAVDGGGDDLARGPGRNNVQAAVHEGSPPWSGRGTVKPGRPSGGAYFETLLEETTGQSASRRPNAEDTGSLHEELRQMRESFQGLARQLSQTRGGWPAPNTAAAGDEVQTKVSAFQGLGIDDEVLQQFAEMLPNGSPEEADSADTDDPLSLLEHLMTRIISFEDSLSESWTGQKRMAFIGATGVGKTTTIAKVAANYMLAGGGKVLLATIDNYRIAAVEQLKIYGRIMNMPVEVARRPEELREIVGRHADADLILVDTAGRSPRDEIRQQELAAFLNPELGIENHLVLSAVTRETDLYNSIDRFAHLNLRGLVLTKLDECDSPGQIVNLGVRGGYPLSFLTNGQKVPEDLVPSDSREVAKLILNQNKDVAKWMIDETGTRQELCVH